MQNFFSVRTTADQRDLGDDPRDEVGGRTARTDAGGGARVVPEVVGHLDRVILNRHVEVVERAEEVRPEAGAVGRIKFSRLSLFSERRGSVFARLVDTIQKNKIEKTAGTLWRNPPLRLSERYAGNGNCPDCP